MTAYYVGLISGTSMDGIDAVLVDFAGAQPHILSTHAAPYPDDLRASLLAAIREPLDVAIDTDGVLHRRVGECFRDAALHVVDKAGFKPNDIVAIGSHGQTLRHCPDAEPPFSLQIGDPELIAAGTGITTVANFRQADIEAGGQGAPLVPPFHEWLFRSPDVHRVVVNIGGIANVTILPAGNGVVTGFDTGPGNGLMDAWIRRQLDEPYDANGAWAASGSVDAVLLAEFLNDPYFRLPPPKSTGFEYFNLDWLSAFGIDRRSTADVQSTLAELTARTIADAIRGHAPQTTEVFVCGGGAHNAELLKRLDRNLPETKNASTAALGLEPDWVEACAFAWLAMRTHNGKPGNLPSVTGANKRVTLGEIHFRS